MLDGAICKEIFVYLDIMGVWLAGFACTAHAALGVDNDGEFLVDIGHEWDSGKQCGCGIAAGVRYELGFGNFFAIDFG